MYSYSIYIGLQVVPIWVHWAQSIQHLGTWTLRVTHTKSYLSLACLLSPVWKSCLLWPDSWRVSHYDLGTAHYKERECNTSESLHRVWGLEFRLGLGCRLRGVVIKVIGQGACCLKRRCNLHGLERLGPRVSPKPLNPKPMLVHFQNRADTKPNIRIQEDLGRTLKAT